MSILELNQSLKHFVMNVYDFVTYIDEPVSKLFPLNLIKQSSFSSLTVFVLDIVNLYITWKF